MPIASSAMHFFARSIQLAFPGGPLRVRTSEGDTGRHMARLEDLKPGVVIGGDYELVEPLRAGGMGAVYIVEQQSTGSRRALKVMHPSIASDAPSRERFRQEARAGSKIQSEHVVQVMGAGFDDRLGLPWLVMELLEGKDLSEELSERTRIPAGEVLTIFEQLCHAVGAAHRVGIVHRDLKPENVFLARSRRADSKLSVKVLDFGIAKVVAEAQASNTGAIGTPLYMAPEQTVAGETITAATDVWALGLIVFKLLTGTNFWKTARSKEPSSMMMLREVAIDPIPPALQRARELEVDGYLPHGFDVFFARCLDRDATRRFQNANELFEGLSSILQGQPGHDAGETHAEFAKETSPDPTPPAVSGEDDATVDVPPRRRGLAGVSLAVVAGIAVLVGGYAFLVGDGSGAGASGEGANPAPAATLHCPRDMAPILGGTYRMGDLPRTVRVASFCIDLDEVTSAEYGACVKGGTCDATGLDCGETEGWSPGEADGGDPKRRRRPISCVSYGQAEKFCKAREMRLPTEEEWEWVARRGDEATAYPWGNDPPAGQLCWSGESARKEGCVVGAYAAGDTPEHVRDLAGSVSEWTSSRSENQKRVIRGSSWADDEARFVRSAHRSLVGVDHRHEQLGFRCAKDPS